MIVLSPARITSAVEYIVAALKVKIDPPQPVTIYGVLDAAYWFTADVSARLSHPLGGLTVKFVKYQSYSGTIGGDIKQIWGPEGKDVYQKQIVVLDTLCDSGRTFDQVVKDIKILQPESIITACLIRRDRPQAFVPDIVGMKYSGDEFLHGYGLDAPDGTRRNEYSIGY